MTVTATKSELMRHTLELLNRARTALGFQTMKTLRVDTQPEELAALIPYCQHIEHECQLDEEEKPFDHHFVARFESVEFAQRVGAVWNIKTRKFENQSYSNMPLPLPIEQLLWLIMHPELEC